MVLHPIGQVDSHVASHILFFGLLVVVRPEFVSKRLDVLNGGGQKLQLLSHCCGELVVQAVKLKYVLWRNETIRARKAVENSLCPLWTASLLRGWR